MPSALEKLKTLRAACDARGLSPWLEVDGGVDAVTGPECVAAGANLLVAGSAVFGKADMAAAVRGLKSLERPQFCNEGSRALEGTTTGPHPAG